MTNAKERIKFEITAEGSVGAIEKNDDGDFVIWGPASVEVVDKENDRIKASALEDALPQLLKRSTLSYEHSDQIVGEILDKFETDEPVEVEVGDEVIERSEFPTDVLDDELDNPALFVAGKVYGDTQRSEEVREAIDKGDIRSYSISGEAVSDSFNVVDGEPITDIEKLDLSAVTLCSEGMNQQAKFGVVKKRDPSEGSAPTALGPTQAESIIKSQTMADNDDETLTKSGMQELLDKNLPDGEIPTVEKVEGIARTTAKQVVKENATNTVDESEGTSDRPSGDDNSPVEEDPTGAGEGDSPDETASDSDKVEEKSMNAEEMKSVLKDVLPDDQFKAIAPTIEEKMGEEDMPVGDDPLDEDPDPDPEPEEDLGDDMPLEEVEPSDEPEDEESMDVVERKAKALGMDPGMLTATQRQKIAKADVSALEKAGGASPPSGGVGGEPAHAGSEPDDDNIVKEDASTVSGSNFFDSDGGVKL